MIRYLRADRGGGRVSLVFDVLAAGLSGRGFGNFGHQQPSYKIKRMKFNVFDFRVHGLCRTAWNFRVAALNLSRTRAGNRLAGSIFDGVCATAEKTAFAWLRRIAPGETEGTLIESRYVKCPAPFDNDCDGDMLGV
ncbi:MAG: hypothetical protein ACU843_01465 [Gammaproteobacteria bacterium]